MEKFSAVLNSLPDDDTRANLEGLLQGVSDTPINVVTPEEVFITASEISSNKTAGQDKIPGDLYKIAPSFLFI